MPRADSCSLHLPASCATTSGSLSACCLPPPQERDLEELLDMFAMGIGDAEEFQDRLQDEFSALEVSCVLGMLAAPACWL